MISTISTALCLPAPDIEALIQGRIIAAVPRISIKPGSREFALYACDTFINPLPDERYYRSKFLPIAQNALASLDSQKVLIKAWATCEHRKRLDNTESFDALSRLTVWTTDALQETLSQRGHIFLTYLRVYLLSQPIEVPVHLEVQEKNGKFISLPQRLTVSESWPVLSDHIFTQRRRQLENLEPPLHPELEELQSAIALLSATNPAAEELDQSIRIFLGWSSNQTAKRLDSDLA